MLAEPEFDGNPTLPVLEINQKLFPSTAPRKHFQKSVTLEEVEHERFRRALRDQLAKFTDYSAATWETRDLQALSAAIDEGFFSASQVSKFLENEGKRRKASENIAK